jgi:hypothetical protein
MSDSDIKILCWGCNGPHPYRDRHTKEIICPNKDKPGVAEAAKVAHQKYLQGLKKSRQGWVQKKKVKFSDLSSDERERFRQHLVSQANSTLAINNVGTANIHHNATPANSTPGAFLFPAFVLQNQISKPILPVKIDNNLPFITLILGSPDAPIEECPAVRVLVDTDAGLSTGYWGYWSHLLKAHPDCVENMWTVADGVHGPVVLGGVIVGEGGDMTNHTTELTVVVEVRLRYETTHGQPVIHSIAMGNNVGVNTIVGKHFFTKLGCVIDLANGVVEATKLRTKPFAIDEMFPQRYDTEKKVANRSPNPNYAAIVQKIDLISKFFTAGTVTTGEPGALSWKLAPGCRVNGAPSSAPILKPSSYPVLPISDGSSTSDVSEFDSMATVDTPTPSPCAIWGKASIQPDIVGSAQWGHSHLPPLNRAKRFRFELDQPKVDVAIGNDYDWDKKQGE